MKKSLLIVPAVIAMAIAGAVVFGGNSADAATACNVTGINNGPFGTEFYVGKNDTAFKLNGNTITGTFKVTGTAGCTTPVTLAIWKSPSKNGQPVIQQTLYSYKTITVGPGTHTISATIPNCYYQADLLQSANPKAPDGTANYGWQNGDWVKNGPYRGAAYGGSMNCPVETTETPSTPATPVATTPVATTTTLPVTGPSMLLAPIAGLMVAAAVAHNLIQRRRLARR